VGIPGRGWDEPSEVAVGEGVERFGFGRQVVVVGFVDAEAEGVGLDDVGGVEKNLHGDGSSYRCPCLRLVTAIAGAFFVSGSSRPYTYIVCIVTTKSIRHLRLLRSYLVLTIARPC
jgi:hypothetical protein